MANSCQCVEQLFTIRSSVLAVPVPEVNVTQSQGLDYLVQFGYLEPQDPKTGALRSEQSFTQALKTFQKMAGIPQTGQLDNMTQAMMKLPRCGNKDNIELGMGARKKRYALQGSKWAKHNLTFKISEYPRGLSRDRAEKEVYEALKVWGNVTPLNFILRPFDEKVDIDIKFARRQHGDGNPFDGRGQTLAHAFFPQYGGDAHFDDDEEWTINLSSGINMFQVAAHEFGHSLGLSHSDVSTSLMAPFYRGYQRHFQLDHDDITAIQELYGQRRIKNNDVTKIIPKQTSTVTTRVPKICNDPKIDAVTMTSDGHTYIFKGKQYYRLSSYGIADGYPRDIAQDWKGVEGPIDSALHWDNGYTYIFKGDYYWKFYNFNLIYVRSIEEGFKGLPGNIDAAFVWGGNGKTYFIKGNQYWRYTLNHVDPGYPKPMSVWTGLPSHIDAALKWKNGRTYFYSGDMYYRYNDVEFNIDKSYPRPIGEWWFGCPDKEQMKQLIGDTTTVAIRQGENASVSADVPSSHNVAREKWTSTNGGRTIHLYSSHSKVFIFCYMNNLLFSMLFISLVNAKILNLIS
uniref:Peptidase metallopeptidase domain-containing protein n=1 Tax=Biomphalaria glabrata TaxID=6526 RepID=A0A2C9KBK3_BIOGL